MARKGGGGASRSTEPARGSSSGTDVPLRDYLVGKIVDLEERVAQQFELNDKALQAALIAQEKAVAAALTAAKEAVDKAETAAGKRFEATNEFRAQLADQAATFVRGDVYTTHVAAKSQELSLIRTDVRALTDRVNTSAARGSAFHDGWGYLVGAIGVAAAVVAVLVR